MTGEASNIAPAWNRAHSNLLDIKNSSTWTVSFCGHNHFLTPLDSTHHQVKSHLQELATKLAPFAWLMQSVKPYDLQAKLWTESSWRSLISCHFKWHRCKSDIEWPVNPRPSASRTSRAAPRAKRICGMATHAGFLVPFPYQIINFLTELVHTCTPAFLSLPEKWNWNH